MLAGTRSVGRNQSDPHAAGRGHRSGRPRPPTSPQPDDGRPAGRLGGTRSIVGRRAPAPVPTGAPASTYLLGCGVIRRYGLTALKPFGNRSLASSSETAGTMTTSSPSFQLTGVATL